MNKNQINKIKDKLDVFSKIDLGKMIAVKYKVGVDLTRILIGEYSVNEYVSAFGEVLKNFREEIDGVYAKAMPFEYHFQNEYGSGDLLQELDALLHEIATEDFPASTLTLNKLIHYQAINGFWEKSKRKYFRSSEISVQEAKDRVDLVSKHLDEESKRLSGLIGYIYDEKDELSRFIRSKGSELSEIESLLEAARKHTDAISEMHTKSATLDVRITSLLEQAEEKKHSTNELVDKSKVLLSEVAELLKESKNENESQKKVYDKLGGDFNEKLSFFESKKEYFEERNQYLDDLIEREVGASLFETFKQRKKELVTSIGFWKWTVPVTAIATIAWIFFLFGNGDLSNLSWQVILVNSLKALPSIGLLLFAISQYVKERNFQEEYAFKSAVALTVSSYAEQLTEKGNKDKMIMESVGQIYKSPIHHKYDAKDASALSSAVKKYVETDKSSSPLK